MGSTVGSAAGGAVGSAAGGAVGSAAGQLGGIVRWGCLAATGSCTAAHTGCAKIREAAVSALLKLVSEAENRITLIEAGRPV